MNRRNSREYGRGGFVNDGASERKLSEHPHKIANALHDSWLNMRHLASAALASGKLALIETKLKRLQKERERIRNKAADRKMITTRGGKRFNGQNAPVNNDNTLIGDIGSLPGDESYTESFDDIESIFSDDDEEETTEELLDDDYFQQLADEKTYNALLTAHQTEVLWKLTKIDLDSTIREACRKILMLAPGNGYGGWCSFFPSEFSPYPNDWYAHRPDVVALQDGWVGQDGSVIPKEVGRLRAAAALVLVGDILVRCGKGDCN
jgi:hypothetical protein